MERLVISAPFGNYFHLPNCTSTLGTFTTEYRGGIWKRLWRAMSTVRYHPGIQGWTNNMGLPNPGVEWLRNKQYPDKIISVMGFDCEQWLKWFVNVLALKQLQIEENENCPNFLG